jgi:hypothetical protein
MSASPFSTVSTQSGHGPPSKTIILSYLVRSRVQTQLIDPISGRGLLPAVFDGENIRAIVARLAGSVHGDPDQVSAIPALLH